MTYHGYPQHPDAHPERPWWRKLWQRRGNGSLEHIAWQRIRDRATVSVLEVRQARFDVLAHHDLEHPLPAPPPLCGQVWVDLDEVGPVGGMTITAVGPYVAVAQMSACYVGILFRRGIVRHQGFRHAEDAPEHVRAEFREVEWPPSNCVLVAGSFSPWSYPEKSAEKPAASKLVTPHRKAPGDATTP